jgi:hypothetical protein
MTDRSGMKQAETEAEATAKASRTFSKLVGEGRVWTAKLYTELVEDDLWCDPGVVQAALSRPVRSAQCRPPDESALVGLMCIVAQCRRVFDALQDDDSAATVTLSFDDFHLTNLELVRTLLHASTSVCYCLRRSLRMRRRGCVSCMRPWCRRSRP